MVLSGLSGYISQSAAAAGLLHVLYKTITTLKYTTVDDIPHLYCRIYTTFPSNLWWYTEKKLCMHSYDILFPLNDWSQQHAVASKVVYVLYQAEAVASLLNNQAASISSSHWLWRYRVQADMPHIFSQAKPVEATATHHYRTTISSDFSWCSSSITTICTTTTTTPLAFRNLMDNLWEKGKKRKEYKPLQHQHQHTYYHTILLLSLLHQIYNYIYIYYAHTTMYYYIYTTTTTVFCNLYCLI